MEQQQTILVKILSVMACIAVLFLIIYGAVSGSEALWTVGVSIVNFVLGVFMSHYFDSKHINMLEETHNEWREDVLGTMERLVRKEEKDVGQDKESNS